MKSTNKPLKWLDKHLLELLAGFLLAFLPLYPKWPLFDVLPGYIVRVRLEDFIILFALTIFAIQVKRGKAKLRSNPLFKPIALYWLIGLLSSVSAILITRSVPLETAHVGKLFLHWARRVEYMSVAFIFFSAIQSTQSLKRILKVFVVTAVLVSLYGFGQKYLAWPVYSTMNREFAKGWRLILTEHARVSSTFAGHYDLAAFSLAGLSTLASFIILTTNRYKYLYMLSFLLLFATLLLTASRTSFIAYLASLTILCFLLIKKIGFKKSAVSWVLFMIVSGVGIRSFGTLYSRFAHILMLDRVEIFVQEQFIARLKPKPAADIQVTGDLSLVYTETDTPPTVVKPPPAPGELPPDVYQSIPESFPEASLSAIPATSGTGLEGKSRTYSDSAYRYGLSSAIRFDALWPRALEGLKKNPLLGSGYSTLTKVETTEFTEAESTDNDYLRALGETGILGFMAFYGIFALVIYKSFVFFQATKDKITTIYLAGFIAAIFGLLINALYIDVFESSKVAYTLWALIGITFGIISTSKPKHEKT